MKRSGSPFTDQFARRLLARAAEIDATLGTPTSLARLRTAALEAGIHPAAFDRAARELIASTDRANQTVWSQVRQNLLAAGVFWVTMAAIVQPLIWLDVAAPARTLGMLIAGFAGIQIADRLRARLVRTALIAVNAGQAVLFGFSLAGIASSGPNVLTWAVFLTGVLATGAAALYGRMDRRLPPPAECAFSDPEETPQAATPGEPPFTMMTPAPASVGAN